MRAIFILLILLLPLSADWFPHRTTDTNSDFNVSILPSHLTADSNLRLFIHPRARPFKGNHPNRNLGVYYAGNYWAYFYEDQVNTVDPQLEMSVFLPEAGDEVFVHTHNRATQTIFKRSYLDHPSLNNKPNALVFLTHNYTAGGNVYNNQFSPVIYHASSARWFIHGYINGDEFTEIPNNASWNVHVVPAANANTYRHVATTANTNSSEGVTILNHPLLNNNPNALILVTNHWPIDFNGATFSQMESRYDSSLGRWTLETIADYGMQIGSAFHIKVSAGPETPEPNFTISYLPPTASLSFPSEFGYSYQLQASPDLVTFHNEGFPFGGNGFTRSYPTTVVLPNNNYRLIRTVGEPAE